MACFVVPAVEAVAVTVAAQVVKKHEERQSASLNRIQTQQSAISWSRKLNWLSYLLWGGVLLLAFEHVWHGEVVPYFPFLTAMNDPGDTLEMLHEMSTVGMTMAVIVTVAWGAIVAAADILVHRGEPGKAA